MAENPLKRLIPTDQEGKGLGSELKERIRMQKEASDSLKGGAMAIGPAKPVGPAAPASPVDKTNTQGPYGTGAGEKRIDVKDMTKPLGQMHAGGTVPKTGAYVMKAGEKVLTPEQHGHLQSAMSLAQSALSHEAEPAPPPPAKVGRDFHARRLDDKTFHIRKGHASPMDHPEEESSAPDMKGLIQHLKDHFGEEKQESPGVQAAEETVGLK